MAWDRDGHFYFTDVPRAQLFKIDAKTGEKTLVDGATGRANGIAFGADGRLYGCASGEKRIYAWDTKIGQKVAVAEGTLSNDIVALRDGTLFYTEPAAMLVWRLAPGTFAREVAVKLAWKPNLTTQVDEDAAGSLLKLIDTLDDDDDVQAVWGNYDIPSAVMEKLG
jgi:streptogramin lyase